MFIYSYVINILYDFTFTHIFTKFIYVDDNNYYIYFYIIKNKYLT